MNPTQRFSTRVENYVRYRPRYPKSIVHTLAECCSLKSDSTIADIGSGTGILSEIFLENGNRVYAVEPNAEMRQAAERLLGCYGNFLSRDGSAENTNLSSDSIDFITAGQAFHWFDPKLCRSEFKRILRTEGWVVLIWNDRQTEASPFSNAYELLLREFATDYDQATHKRIDVAAIKDFLGVGPKEEVFQNEQRFEFESLKGRLLSSSYAPEQGQPRHEPMIQQLRRIFEEHQQGGTVAIDYDTRVFYARPAW